MKHHSSLCRVISAVVLAGGALFCHGENTSEWWRTFNDSHLDTLIAMGEANNYDVSMAMRRIEMAKAAVRQAESAWYPQLGLQAGWSKARQSGRLTGREGSATGTSYLSGDVTMSWEIDVFGKVRAQVNHDKKQVQLSSAEFDGAMLTVQASIASAYFTLLMHRAQLAVANEHAANQKHLLDITETRYRTKLVSKLDVAQASTLYYGTESSIPMLESSVEADYNAIALLLGLERAQLPVWLYDETPLPATKQDIPEIPADLIRRRPDVVAAEKSIEVAAAALGIARSEYLPSLSLQASAGTAAHNIGDVFDRPAFTYSVAPTLSWTIFDGFGRRAATASAQENMKLEVDNYNMTALGAAQEVNNALTSYNSTIRYIDMLQKAVDSSRESVTLSIDQYKQGLTDFYNVVEAHLNYLTYQNNLVSARGQALTSLIDLYKSLGGGF